MHSRSKCYRSQYSFFSVLGTLHMVQNNTWSNKKWIFGFIFLAFPAWSFASYLFIATAQHWVIDPLSWCTMSTNQNPHLKWFGQLCGTSNRNKNGAFPAQLGFFTEPIEDSFCYISTNSSVGWWILPKGSWLMQLRTMTRRCMLSSSHLSSSHPLLNRHKWGEGTSVFRELRDFGACYVGEQYYGQRGRASEGRGANSSS